MARCRSHASLFALGALAGAATTLLLLPDTRRAIQAGLRRALYDLRVGESVDNEHITQEAGAVEGGLAATRRWGEPVRG